MPREEYEISLWNDVKKEDGILKPLNMTFPYQFTKAENTRRGSEGDWEKYREMDYNPNNTKYLDQWLRSTYAATNRTYHRGDGTEYAKISRVKANDSKATGENKTYMLFSGFARDDSFYNRLDTFAEYETNPTPVEGEEKEYLFNGIKAGDMYVFRYRAGKIIGGTNKIFVPVDDLYLRPIIAPAKVGIDSNGKIDILEGQQEGDAVAFTRSYQKMADWAKKDENGNIMYMQCIMIAQQDIPREAFVGFNSPTDNPKRIEDTVENNPYRLWIKIQPQMENWREWPGSTKANEQFAIKDFALEYIEFFKMEVDEDGNIIEPELDFTNYVKENPIDGHYTKRYDYKTWFEEEKFCVIGSHTMDATSRATEPKLECDDKGQNTLSFKMYTKCHDIGEGYDNPFLPYIHNEGKIKCKWQNKWYDFIIKDIQRDSSNKSVTVTCKDQYINELSRTGFDITLNTELENNMGTALELTEKALQHSGWKLDSENSEEIQQKTTERVIRAKVMNDVEVVFDEQKDADYGEPKPEGRVVSKGEEVLLYYSCPVSQNPYCSFLYNENKENWIPAEEGKQLVFVGTKGDYTCAQYSFDNATYKSVDDSRIQVYKNDALIFEINLQTDVASDLQGARLVRKQKSVYDNLAERYVSVYNAYPNDGIGVELKPIIAKSGTTGDLVLFTATNIGGTPCSGNQLDKTILKNDNPNDTGYGIIIQPNGDNVEQTWGYNSYLKNFNAGDDSENNYYQNGETLIRLESAEIKSGQRFYIPIDLTTYMSYSFRVENKWPGLIFKPFYSFFLRIEDNNTKIEFQQLGENNSYGILTGIAENDISLSQSLQLYIKNIGHTAQQSEGIKKTIYHSYSSCYKIIFPSLKADYKPHEIHHFTKSETYDTSMIVNFMTNPTNFSSTDGWQFIGKDTTSFTYEDGEIKWPVVEGAVYYALDYYSTDKDKEGKNIHRSFKTTNNTVKGSPMVNSLVTVLGYNNQGNIVGSFQGYPRRSFSTREPLIMSKDWIGTSITSDELSFDVNNMPWLRIGNSNGDGYVYNSAMASIPSSMNDGIKKGDKFILRLCAARMIPETEKMSGNTSINLTRDCFYNKSLCDNNGNIKSDYILTKDNVQNFIKPVICSFSMQSLDYKNYKNSAISYDSIVQQQPFENPKQSTKQTIYQTGDGISWENQGYTWIEYELTSEFDITVDQLKGFSSSNYTGSGTDRYYGLFFKPNSHSAADGEICIQDIEFFRKIDLENTNTSKKEASYIEPDWIDTKSALQTTYYYYDYTDQVVDKGVNSFDDLAYLYKDTKVWNNLAMTPVYNENKNTKFLAISSIEAKQSNHYNILQSIAEKFQCYLSFNIEHNDNGTLKYDETTHLPNKTITVKRLQGNDTGLSFVYGLDLKSIKRGIKSDSITTKTYVLQNSNEFGEDGFCAIGRSDNNYSGENYIFNFDYFVERGFIDGAQLTKDLYQPSGGYIGYYVRMKYYNDIIYELEKLYQSKVTAYKVISQKYDLLKEYLSETESEITNSYNELASYASITSYKIPNEDGTELIDWPFDEKNLMQWANAWYIRKLSTDSTRQTIASHIFTIASIKKKHKEYSAYVDPMYYSISSLKYEIDEYKNYLTEVKESKQKLYYLFHERYGAFIQEGQWSSDDYYDDNLYYFEGMNVAYDSSRPKVEYTFDVFRLSSLEEFKLKRFNIHDYAYIEDKEFFGTVNIDGIITPHKEKVIITGATYNFDSPSKDTFKVQNYRTQFDDLFQQTIATVQSLKFAQGQYNNAASKFATNGTIMARALQASLSQNPTTRIASLNGQVKSDATGFLTVDPLNTGKQSKQNSGSLTTTSNGGMNWLSISAEMGSVGSSYANSVISNANMTINTINSLFDKE